MKDDEFSKQIREAFVSEGGELVRSMAAGLSELAQEPAPARRMEVVETISRDAHSLRGAAAVVGVAARSEIDSLCQELGNIFRQWKTSGVTAVPEAFGPLHRAVDLLGYLVRQTSAGMDPADQMNVSRILHELVAMSSSSRQ